MAAAVIAKARSRRPLDPATRLAALIGLLEPRLRRRFLAIIDRVRRQRSLPELARLIRAGRAAEALDVVDRAATLLAAESARIFVASATSTATWMAGHGIAVAFDQVNDFAVNAQRIARLDLIRGFTADQRTALRAVLTEAVEEGVNPLETARRFSGSLGLAPGQVRAVQRYRELLRANSSEALSRDLRDRRSDPRVARAARPGGEPLDEQSIGRMVDRYRVRMVQHRATVIARTETLRAVHEGSEEMYRQAIASEDLNPAELVRRWNSALDARVRDSHRAMHGQLRPYGLPFLSGAGYTLRYPGDPSAPASETIHCRCVVSTRIML